MAKEIHDETTHVNDETPDDDFNKAFDELLEHAENDKPEETLPEEEEDPTPQGSEAEADETPVEDEDQGDEIPEHLVAAGRSAGLDDDEIAKLAENYPKALEAMARREVPVEAEPEPASIEDEPEDTEVKHIEIAIPEGIDEGTKAILEQMAGNQNTLIDQLNAANSKIDSFDEHVANQQAIAQQEEDAAIDTFFDTQTEACPALGQNETLTEAELGARQEVYRLAEVINGNSLKERLTKAVNAFNGMAGTAEQNLGRKLYKNKAKFSPRPGGKKPQPTFKHKDDQARAAMEEVLDNIDVE